MTYLEIVNNFDWLEDTRKGRFSRYAIDGENSVWVDHENEVIADPDDDDPYDDE